MKINVASINPAKVEAVRETLQDYPHLKQAEVSGLAVNSGVPEQPLTLDETMQGAINRAKNSFQNCDLSFGIESGFFPVGKTNTGFMEVSVCAIYDGKNFHFGFSPAFECPDYVMKYINQGFDLSQACNKAGLSDNPEIGTQQGIIGILTKGRVTRKEYTIKALQMALIHLEKD